MICIWLLFRRRSCEASRKRLALIYPILTVFLVLTLARSLWLAYLWWIGGSEGAYRTVWNASQPIELMLFSAVALEAFWKMARHYRGIFGFAAFLATLFTAFSVGVILLTAGVGTLAIPGRTWWLLASRNFNLACALWLGLSYGFFRIAHAQMRPNVSRNTRILLLFFGTQAVSSAALYVNAGWQGKIVGCVTYTGVPLLCFVLWAFVLTPEGEDPGSSLGTSDGDWVRKDLERNPNLISDLIRGARQRRTPHACF